MESLLYGYIKSKSATMFGVWKTNYYRITTDDFSLFEKKQTVVVEKYPFAECKIVDFDSVLGKKHCFSIFHNGIQRIFKTKTQTEKDKIFHFSKQTKQGFWKVSTTREYVQMRGVSLQKSMKNCLNCLVTQERSSLERTLKS